MILRQVLTAMTFLAAGTATMAQSQTQNLDEIAKGYVGTETCATCHEDESLVWEESHHALAWTEATEENVLGNFDGAEFVHEGVATRFDREGQAFVIHVTEEDGSKKRFEVHSVAGIAPLQQYLIETEPGKLQSFDVVWDVEREEWYHLYPDQHLPPDDGLHWTGPYKNWNARCAECHATGFRKNYDSVSQSYASDQVEIGVGCEACHGPGRDHVEWAENGAKEDGQGSYFSMNFAEAGAEGEIQQCAGCHSRREAQLDGNPLPGTPYHDAYALSLLRPGMYHPDGQIRDEVYVYGSFLQSKMYEKGVQCSNCHDPHSVQLKAEGNAVCTQCHSPAGNPEFTSLTQKDYDTADHHFHPEGSEGAQCKSCHMIERDYMGIDGRRDHSFRIPRPDLAAASGSPDACTDCHDDRSPEWAAEEIAAWYPDSVHRGSHYGTVFAKGFADPVSARSELVSLATSEGEASIVRATALWLLEAAADEDLAETLAPLLSHPDPLIRSAAIRPQSGANPQESVLRLVELLGDPVRLVRTETVKSLLSAPVARFPEAIASNFQRAMGEWRESLSNRTDFPETHLVLGGAALGMRNLPAATEAFRTVVQLDPQREDAWSMLVRIKAAEGDMAGALSVVTEARSKLPESEFLLQMEQELKELQ
ncbi:multiheme c-type cytochrome [Halocynthiibacter sp. C4]|nr:multiheme c-type cytochrome [Halocynthiibacter sp. C4]